MCNCNECKDISFNIDKLKEKDVSEWTDADRDTYSKSPTYISECVEQFIEEHDTWSVADEMAKITLVFLKKFKGARRFSNPRVEVIERLANGENINFFTFEATIDESARWEAILDEMILGFDILVNVFDFDRTEEQNKAVENSLALYTKWFHHLWW